MEQLKALKQLAEIDAALEARIGEIVRQEDRQVLVREVLARVTGIPYQRFLEGALDDKDWPLFIDAAKRISRLPIYLRPPDVDDPIMREGYFEHTVRMYQTAVLLEQELGRWPTVKELRGRMGDILFPVGPDVIGGDIFYYPMSDFQEMAILFSQGEIGAQVVVEIYPLPRGHVVMLPLGELPERRGERLRLLAVVGDLVIFRLENAEVGWLINNVPLEELEAKTRPLRQLRKWLREAAYAPGGHEEYNNLADFAATVSEVDEAASWAVAPTIEQRELALLDYLGRLQLTREQAISFLVGQLEEAHQATLVQELAETVLPDGLVLLDLNDHGVVELAVSGLVPHLDAARRIGLVQELADTYLSEEMGFSFDVDRDEVVAAFETLKDEEDAERKHTPGRKPVRIRRVRSVFEGRETEAVPTEDFVAKWRGSGAKDGPRNRAQTSISKVSKGLRKHGYIIVPIKEGTTTIAYQVARLIYPDI